MACKKCWPWDCSCIDGWNFSLQVELKSLQLEKKSEGFR